MLYDYENQQVYKRMLKILTNCVVTRSNNEVGLMNERLRIDANLAEPDLASDPNLSGNCPGQDFYVKTRVDHKVGQAAVSGQSH